MVNGEVPRVMGDIERMWGEIARRAGRPVEEVEEQRRAIVQRVEMRRRYVWVSRWRAAVTSRKELPQAPWYQRWLMGEGEEGMELDSFDLSVGEQVAAHVVLPDVPAELINYFGRNPEQFPGMVLRPGIKRVYPYGHAGCHLIGHLAKVTREDLLEDEGGADELRKYWPNDIIGRSGVEALAEPLLRGSRGRVVRKEGEDEEHVEPKGGTDVYLTVDIELQRQLQGLFKDVVLVEQVGDQKAMSRHEMHGAAVVIDVATGEVRAMASYPDYDLNRFEEDYSKLSTDVLDFPLLNRATQVAREPGSTAKPVVGLGAIGAGISSAQRGIECTGYLVLNGTKYGMGRCWVASRFAHLGINVSHHQIPSHAPHPTGFLNLADALERSCNVYFETLGDKLGVEGVSRWMRAFGIGRYTGIGIGETAGYVPADFRIASGAERSTSWFASIGQGKVAATPLQMAGVAATIARDGVWMKPRLLATGTPLKVKPATRPTATSAPEEDRIDLHLPAGAVRAAREGMKNVVYAPAGTGRQVAHLDDNDRVLEPSLAHLKIAGKTGTAQASRVRVPAVDREGRPVKDEGGRDPFLKASVPGRDNPAAGWYRATDAEGTNFNHAWFVGFAPAENPKVAFAVMVEYGGSGGATAGRVAKRVVEACIQHGYLPAGRG
jgi:penicillin-binding protein 2